MKGFFMRLKGMMGSSQDNYDVPEEEDEGYVELSTDAKEGGESKIAIKPFVLEDFEGVKPILDSLREGYTIALVNIKPLKDADIVELKRAINKIKKTCDAVEGDIAGFGDDWLCVTPSFAFIQRETRKPISLEKNDPRMQAPELDSY